MPITADLVRAKWPRRATGRLTAGFALIEVLIALLIMAIGMLGLAGMLVIGNKANSSSYLKQQAIQSAYDIVDRMRANKAQAVLGAYNQMPSPTGAPDCNTALCSADEIASYDLSYWFYTDLAQLPGGTGSITSATAGSNTLVTVTVQWDDKPAQAKLGSASASVLVTPNLAEFTVQTLL
ncbi:MAG: type IV pilus modification protein PilV [Burkholderiaceae bacterium]